MNLYNLALTGLNASQAGLETTSHNINNATTVGYSRQRVITSTAGAGETGQGFFGRGVQVDTVTRQYDSFLYRQLVGAQGSSAQLSTHLAQVSQVNNLFGDRTVGITPALAGLFTSTNAAATKPADPAVRADMIGKANSLVTQINTAYQELENQRNGLNTQISTTVEQANSYLERINDLNKKIVIARGKDGHAPNDLLDQRDQAVSELNQLTGIRFYEQGDAFNITLQSGQTLLSGTTVYPLQAVPSASDPKRLAVAYTLPSGPGTTIQVEMNDSEVTGGQLGGLLSFRSQSLDAVQDQLGQLAIGLAMAFNAQHRQGYDLDGQPGGDMFGLQAPAAIRNSGNTSTGEWQSAYTDADAIRASAYRIQYDGANYTVTRLSDGSSFDVTPSGTPPTLSFDGLTLTGSGTPAAGDAWTLQPARDAARDLKQLISDPSKLALADSALGTTNGNNGLKLAELQTAKVLGNGSMSLNEMFSQLVNNVGVQTQQVSTANTAQANLVKQQATAHLSVSGVNLNEEYVNLTIFQEQYQASAKILDVASTVFDTLLGLR
ncbi:flagellar hook-associated protein 1 [Bordetella pertussis]|uniref:Flagellar hook-associated protein 1 n=1 Tax=Bordetella pertussis (strain ATCC 9797 / DSM 5571 / CCUG 30873 / LMG 14455 / NCTC 10739 / 18323) TaxID=568706 RepID=A0A0T7CPU7_BORP1|nr:flagellar hook-associated protein FlgK [Bordetella pertussis]AZR85247.1 flagellar hook-associated protein FlgK [Bordetella pertussis]PNO98096.1 flagellar hook-associated protein FlgK [Bordetella pertussis 18323]UEB58410.1 flagellar hook-associated protein FlgK [Bordetella pertussis]CCJ63656.1 flagellar hook-associated protein 1 [Bordetella pertussis 18323]CFP51980.1 flagellar hook-associated protein 1 [Bordetella pertussis]